MPLPIRRLGLFLWLVPRNVLIGLIVVYRKLISPLYGDVCRYYPTCSSYGLQQIQSLGVIKGSVLTGWRILRCNPWSTGGIDQPALPPSYLRVGRLGFVSPQLAE